MSNNGVLSGSFTPLPIPGKTVVVSRFSDMQGDTHLGPFSTECQVVYRKAHQVLSENRFADYNSLPHVRP